MSQPPPQDSPTAYLLKVSITVCLFTMAALVCCHLIASRAGH